MITLDIAKLGVGKGWYGLLEEFYQKKPEWVEVDQVKEKFGSLRIYVHWPTNKMVLEEVERTMLLIEDLERRSEDICEFCGAAGFPRDKSWIKTLCDTCYANWRK